MRRREESILYELQCTQPKEQAIKMTFTGGKRKVRFSEDIRVVTNPIILSIKEQEAMFLTAEDRNCALRATQAELENATRRTYDLVRGLENIVLTPDEMARRHRFMECFLLLQEKLRKSGCDPKEQQDALRDYVSAYTKGGQKEALKLAKWDEKEARKVYKQDRSIQYSDTKRVREGKRGENLLKLLVPQMFRRQ
jgi:hypothetical protein